MKVLQHNIYRLSIFLSLFLLGVLGCKKDESQPSYLKIEGNSADKIWEAKASGDTLRFVLSSDSPTEEIYINNVADWIAYKLEGNSLELFIRDNREVAPRKGVVSLQSISRGTILSSEKIYIRQGSEEELAQIKTLFTLFPKMALNLSEYQKVNKALKFELPKTGGERVFENVFYSTLTPDEVMVEMEYVGNEKDWIKSYSLITNKENHISGIKLNVKKVSGALEQRLVSIKLQDKTFENIHASIVCFQPSKVLEWKNPNDRYKELGRFPENIDLLVKTDIPKEDLSLQIIKVPETKYERYYSADLFTDRVKDPTFLYNYLDDVYDMPVIENFFTIEEAPDGVAIKGVFSNDNRDFGKWVYANQLRYMIILSSKISDQRLSFVLKPGEGRYCYFEGMKKELSRDFPEEGGLISGLRFRSNISVLHPTYPSWMAGDKPGKSDPVALGRLEYPDLYEQKSPIKVFPNTYREDREAVLYLYCNSTSANTIRDESYPMSVNYIHVSQKAFTGDYLMESDAGMSQDFDLSSGASTQSIALKTNLNKEQIRVDKTALASWVRYELKVDSETNYVAAIILYMDENQTDKDRSATLTLQGPKNEGLKEIKFNLHQEH